MSACFGIYGLNGTPASPEHLAKMDIAMAACGQNGGGLYHRGPIALGSRLLPITPEDQYEIQPAVGKCVLVAHARLDNREELCAALDLGDGERVSESTLIQAAYDRWGDACVHHLLGDWVFALWDSARNRLLIARDATGNTGLYWAQVSGLLIFSTGLKGMLAHPLVSGELDPVAFAGLLTAFRVPFEAGKTIYAGIERLLPGSLLIADPHGVLSRPWWEPESLSPLHYPNLDDYYEAFVELYADAVAKRLRIGAGGVAASLSGGLDSSSVVALAAPRLAKQGQRLRAYVHRPLYAPTGAGPDRFGDEFGLAQSTAGHVGNIDPIPILSADFSVLQGVRRSIEIHDAPAHAASNQYWVIEMLQLAHAAGSRVLLTGQGGNATVSFSGDGNLLPGLRGGGLAEVWSALRQDETGLWLALKRRILKPLLRPARARWSRLSRAHQTTPWSGYSAIRAEFANEVGLLNRMRAAEHDLLFSSPLADNSVMRNFRLGRFQGGRGASLLMELGTAFGMEIRDPTRDKRIVEFCWRVPDAVFWARGRQRGLIRDAMKTLLPSEVVLNTRKGLQSADIVERLRAQSQEIGQAIAEIEKHPLCQRWLDLPYMQRIFASLAEHQGPAHALKAQTVLVRGLSAGLFLSRC